RRQVTMSDATGGWSSCLTPARGGVPARVGAAVVTRGAPEFPAVSPAAAARRAAAVPRGGGDAIQPGRSRCDLGRHSRGGSAKLRPDRLRVVARLVRLRLCPHPVVDRAGAAGALAAHLFHPLERAENLSVAARGLCGRRSGVVVDTVAHGARATPVAAHAGAPRGA